MPAHSTEISVPARYAALPELMAWLERSAATLAIGAADAQRLQLIVEELLTNSIRHGHGGECDAAIDLCLGLNDGRPALRYSDDARPFDPTAALPPAEPDAIGGLGLPLIRGLCRSLRYERRAGRNHITLELAGDAAPAAL